MPNELVVLYVEDNQTTSDLTVKILKRLVKTVLTAKNGMEALDIYKDNTVHVIITDYLMPIMNGPQLAREIRSVDKTIPIIITSNHADKEKLKEAIKLNLVDYLEKPIGYDELLGVLNDAAAIVRESGILTVVIGDHVSYDRTRKVVMCDDGSEFVLTKNEVRFLELFLEKRGVLVTKEMICEIVYDGWMSPHQLKNLLNRIKKKIGGDTIVNVKDLGYIMY